MLGIKSALVLKPIGSRSRMYTTIMKKVAMRHIRQFYESVKTGGADNRHKTSRSGFTIVELLIVIVVIGILAAIVIVAYNGVTQRANTARYLSAADAWEKIFRTQVLLGGTLPLADPNPVCLGNAASNFPTSTDLAAGKCAVITNAGVPSAADYSQTFMDGLNKVAPPNGQLPSVRFSDTASGKSVTSRGISANVYQNGSGYNVNFYFYIPSGSNCGHAILLESVGAFSSCQLYASIQP